jgi:hypothetical protein
MSLDINSLLGIFQIVVQFVAAYFSYKIYLFNKENYGWISVTVALVLMSFRRITALLIGLKYISALGGWVALLDRLILPSIISLLLFGGLWSMLKNFENFRVIETKVKTKLKVKK